VPIERYRRVEDMPRPWRSPDDPENLAIAARLLELYRQINGPPQGPRVQKFRSWDEAQASGPRPPHGSR